MTLRRIQLTVGSARIGRAKTWSYPLHDGKHYEIPTYWLQVLGTQRSGTAESKQFEVIRFGVVRKSSGEAAHVVGLADLQWYTIHKWLPSYSVHSARSVEMGAWQVKDDYLIHDGPDDPMNETYATAGCIEICGGPHGFDDFNDYLIRLSGTAKPTRAERLAEIGNAGIMTITYQAARRPALVEWAGPP